MSVEVPVETASPRRKKQKPLHPSFWMNIRNYFSEYTEVSGLHGLRYIGEQNRPILERILWFIIVNLSFAVCVFYILDTYWKWDSTPVIVTLSHSQMPVWKVPFPAVTICPETKFSQNFNFTLFYNKYRYNRANMSDVELKFFGYSSLLCNVKEYVEANFTARDDFFLFARETAPRIEEVIVDCPLRDCLRQFPNVITEEGVCYTFNALDRNDLYEFDVHHSRYFPQKYQFKTRNWTIEKGYAKLAGHNVYPRRVLAAGVEGGLTFHLHAFEWELDYICRTGNQGFKVIVHHPGETPRVNMQYVRVPLDEDVLIAIKPEVITTANSLRSYDPHKRGCYFSDERRLRFYKIYNQENCQMECLTNYTLKFCNCVSFYMPRVNTTSLCGPRDVRCTSYAKVYVATRSIINETIGDCDCLPSCTSTTYNAEISQSGYTYWGYRQYIVPHNDPALLKTFRVSKITIFFKEMQFVTSERHELYGTTDFVANCGGLLGLFTGFSVLSLVEIFYYLTIRMCVNWRKYGRRYWSGSENLLQNKKYAYEKQSV